MGRYRRPPGPLIGCPIHDGFSDDPVDFRGNDFITFLIRMNVGVIWDQKHSLIYIIAAASFYSGLL